MKTNCKFKEFWPNWERHGMGKTKIMLLNIYKDKKLWEQTFLSTFLDCEEKGL